jgi:hypothetical protein
MNKNRFRIVEAASLAAAWILGPVMTLGPGTAGPVFAAQRTVLGEEFTNRW